MTAQLFVIAPKTMHFAPTKGPINLQHNKNTTNCPQNTPPNQMQCPTKSTKKQDQIVCQLGLADLFCKV